MSKNLILIVTVIFIAGASYTSGRVWAHHRCDGSYYLCLHEKFMHSAVAAIAWPFVLGATLHQEGCSE